MSDINFLPQSNKEQQPDEKGKDKPVRAIEWSEPAAPAKEKKSWFSWRFWLRNRIGGQRLRSQTGKTVIKSARRKILKSVKQDQAKLSQNNVNNSKAEEKTINQDKKRANLLFWRGRQKEGGRENQALADYHKIFTEEKGKRKIANNQLQPAELRDSGFEPPDFKDSASLIKIKDFKKAQDGPDSIAAGSSWRAKDSDAANQSNQQDETKLKQASGEPVKPVAKTEPSGGFQKSDILETNLIKGQVTVYFNWSRKVPLLIEIFLLLLIVIGVVYGSLIYWQRQREAEGKIFVDKINRLNFQIKQAEREIEEIINFQQKLRLVNDVFADHIYWTNLFKFLEDNTLANVYYLGFSGSTNGEYSLGAIAKNYAALSDQLKVMRANEKVITVKTQGGDLIQSGVSGVQFQLELKIDPQIFRE